MPSKRPVHIDIFEDNRDGGRSSWLAKARQAQWNLEKVKNPYVGNKRKLIVDLASVIFDEGLSDKINGGNVLDLFSGSGFVSYFFKSMGACVWANDILGSSYLNARSLLFPQHKGKSIHMRNCLAKILADGKAKGTRILDNYCPDRFSEKEAKRLDIIRANMDIKFNSPEQPDSDFAYSSFCRMTCGHENIGLSYYGKPVSNPNKEYDPYVHGMVIPAVAIAHYIMNCCFVGGRLNCGQILAKFDHRISHQRNGGSEMNFSLDDIPLFDIPVYGDRVCRATRSDAIDLLTSNSEYCKKALDSLDVVYIDPPYGGDQSDYSAMYDFIEDFFFYGHKNKEDINDRKRFAYSKTYQDSFIELLESLPKQAVWIFSYNNSSWSDINGITDSIKKFRNNISVSEIDYKYHYRKDQSSGTEYVIIART